MRNKFRPPDTSDTASTTVSVPESRAGVAYRDSQKSQPWNFIGIEEALPWSNNAVAGAMLSCHGSLCKAIGAKYTLPGQNSRPACVGAGEETANERNTVVLKLQVHCKRISKDAMENEKGRCLHVICLPKKEKGKIG